MKAGSLREELDSKSWNFRRNFGSWMQNVLVYRIYKTLLLLQRIPPFGMYFLDSAPCVYEMEMWCLSFITLEAVSLLEG